MIRRIAAPLVAVVAAAAVAFAPSASSSQSPSATAVKAAKDATREAKSVTYAIMGRGPGGRRYGTVTLQRIGSTRSRVRVELTSPAAGASARLRPGSDCTSARVANAPHSILLNPFSGHVSQTVVNVPLTNLQSGNYLLDVRNATARQQAIDACAQLNAGTR